MRHLILLTLAILAIAVAVDAHHKRKSKGKGRQFGFKTPSLKSDVKNFFSKFGGKGSHKSPKSHKSHKKHSHKHHSHSHHSHSHHSHSHSHSHSYSHTHSTQISYNYQVNIKHHYQQEVHCAKHCVPDKAYWKGDHCACHAGLAGAGDLCCTDPKEYKYTCTVRGDPYVHSYMNQNAQVFNPCGQVLAVINAKTSTKKSCQVTIRSADAIEEGIFITNQVETSLRIGGQVGTIIMDGSKVYNSLEKRWVQLGNEYTHCFTVRGERVQILLDRHRKVWTLSACGTLVNFRRDTRGGKPGVCISSKYAYSKRPCDHPKDIVCNRLEEKTAPYHSKATYYLAKSFELKEYLELRLTCAYHNTCKEATTTFNKCCPARKAKAMNVCSAILERPFRSCEALRGGEQRADLFRKFVDCLKAYCEGDQEWCYNETRSDLFIKCKIDNLHCCDFKRGGGGGGKGGGGFQQHQQQKRRLVFRKW